MDDNGLKKTALVKFAGLALGIVIGGMIGPIVFTPAGLNPSAAATAGSFLGAILGYAAISMLVWLERRRLDRELERAAKAVRVEAGLPESIGITVMDRRIVLCGEVEGYPQRREAEDIMSTVPGGKGVINKLRVRSPAGQITATPDEIRKRIEEGLTRRAELEARGIRVALNDSHLTLEGTVHSPVEASTAEEVAWSIPGIREVKNRLEVAG